MTLKYARVWFLTSNVRSFLTFVSLHLAPVFWSLGERRVHLNSNLNFWANPTQVRCPSREATGACLDKRLTVASPDRNIFLLKYTNIRKHKSLAVATHCSFVELMFLFLFLFCFCLYTIILCYLLFAFIIYRVSYFLFLFLCVCGERLVLK